MSARREIPALTRANQAAASDPRLSAWVSAHAGSGKTYVLTLRVLRLPAANRMLEFVPCTMRSAIAHSAGRQGPKCTTSLVRQGATRPV